MPLPTGLEGRRKIPGGGGGGGVKKIRGGGGGAFMLIFVYEFLKD